jgi:hypothetical protein
VSPTLRLSDRGSWRGLTGALLGSLLLAGCFGAAPFSEREGPGDKPPRGDSGAPASDAGADGGDDGAVGDAGDNLHPPMSAPDAGERPRLPAPVRHASCQETLYEWPDKQMLYYEGDEHPYNRWQQGSCEGAAAPLLCSRTEPCSYCVMTEGQSGACATGGGSDTPFVYQQGACMWWVSVEWKRNACCAGLGGNACRRYPFDAMSQGPGELCSTHADCEAGLVCEPNFGRDYARCVCPGVELTQLRNEGSCTRIAQGREPPTRMARGECLPALAGYSVESLPAGMGDSLLAHTSGPGDDLTLITYADFGGLQYVRWHDGHWTAQSLYGGTRASVVADAQGNLHFLVSGLEQLSYRRRDVEGTWTSFDLTGWAPATRVYGGSAIALQLDKHPVIAAVGEDYLFALFATTPSGEGPWQAATLLAGDGVGGADLRIGPDGEVHALASTGWSVSHVVLSPTSYQTQVVGNNWSSSFVRGGQPAIEWIGGGGAWPEQTIELGRIGTEVETRTLWSPPVNRALAVSTPSAARTEEDLYVVFGRPVSAIQDGIALYREHALASSITTLIEEGGSPTLALDGSGRPHVFYGTSRRTPANNNASIYDIRHLFEGDCPKASTP